MVCVSPPNGMARFKSSSNFELGPMQFYFWVYRCRLKDEPVELGKARSTHEYQHLKDMLPSGIPGLRPRTVLTPGLGVKVSITAELPASKVRRMLQRYLDHRNFDEPTASLVLLQTNRDGFILDPLVAEDETPTSPAEL